MVEAVAGGCAGFACPGNDGAVVEGAVEDVLPTAAAAAAAYRTGREAGGREGKPFLSTLDMGCEEVDIGGGGFEDAVKRVCAEI